MQDAKTITLEATSDQTSSQSDRQKTEARNRRKEPRLSAIASVGLQIVRQQEEDAHGYVIETSGHGLGLMTNGPLKPHELVRLKTADYSVLAVARHCSFAKVGYVVGMQLLDDWGSTPEEPEEEDTFPLQAE